MKPEDLKPPFTPSDQQVTIHDRIWYVPQRPRIGSSFIFPGWENCDFFGNRNPVVIEYCSGNGAWIAAKAEENPQLNWVAVERKFDRVRKIWSKVKNRNLSNLLILCGEAYNATNLYVPEHSIQDIYINFPDPWPKKRHAKNRLINPLFSSELSRILIPAGAMTFVTDDGPYSDWTIDVMQQNPLFSSDYPFPFYVTDEETYGSSYFDELWRSKGRQIRYHRFRRC